MTKALTRAAIVLAITIVAAAAWMWAPEALTGEDAGEFPLIASLVAVFAALTLLAWIEDRVAR